MSRNNRVFVVSAPSGTGKTTLNRRLCREQPLVELAVSFTTRPPRSHERHGIDYNFVTCEEFQKLLAKGAMLEHAEVFGHWYGTCISELERIWAAGHVVLLEIDIQGWEEVRRSLPSAEGIFIVPPSPAALWSRLEKRGTDSLLVRQERFLKSEHELEAFESYDFIIVNDQIETAFKELQDILILGSPPRLGRNEARDFCQRLLAEFRQYHCLLLNKSSRI